MCLKFWKLFNKNKCFNSYPVQSNEPLSIEGYTENKKNGLHFDIERRLQPDEEISTSPVEYRRHKGKTRQVNQKEFEPDQHFYPCVLNSQIHPLIQAFFLLGNDRIIARYTHVNPGVKADTLKSILSYSPSHFQWAGSDLFSVTTASGHRQMIVIETNSCPSGQKSMPHLTETSEQSGYRLVIESTFYEQLSKADRCLGGLAVVYDKNIMEASGYAAILADVTQEHVWLAEWHTNDPDVKWIDGVLYIRDEEKEWHPIRACFRYLTQKPWNQLPLNTKTIVMNPIISCLAGGRNKIMAAIAYEFYNTELKGTGLSIRTPKTILNVTRDQIPVHIKSMGGRAVIKVPYSNAGRGVYTITNQTELNNFMGQDHHYDKFIVQSMVHNASWFRATRPDEFYHIGTVPDENGNTYISDLRMMVTGGEHGFRPICMFGRKARFPIMKELQPDVNSWDMLGTNLSVRIGNSWTTDTSRLIIADRENFNQLGLGIDDLIDAYIQTVLTVISIDRMAKRLMTNGVFDYELLENLNPDDVLLDEIRQANCHF